MDTSANPNFSPKQRVGSGPARNDPHPTMRPVALVVRAIRNSGKPRDTVLDCLSGSGTAMVAAERTGRRTVLLEIDRA